MSEVATADGVIVTRRVVTDIVSALGMLEMLAGRQGSILSPRIMQIRRDLISHSVTDDTARTEVVDALDLLLSQPDSMFDVRTAAQQLGLTSAGVRYLIRANRIAATFSAGRWFIPAEEVEAHQAARVAAGKLHT